MGKPQAKPAEKKTGVILNPYAESSGRAVVVSLKPRVDSGRENHHVWDLTLRWPDVDESSLEVLDVYMPGAQGLFDLAASGKATGNTAIKPAQKNVGVVLSTEEGDPISLGDEKIGAELRECKFRTTKKGADLIWKVRLHSVPAEVSRNLVLGLAKWVDIELSPSQQALPFSGDKVEGLEPQSGDLITGVSESQEYAGIVVKLTEEGRVRVEDFGIVREVPIDSVTSVHRVTVAASSLREVMASFSKRCDADGVTPQSAWVVGALAILGSTDGEIAKQSDGVTHVRNGGALLSTLVELATPDPE